MPFTDVENWHLEAKGTYEVVYDGKKNYREIFLEPYMQIDKPLLQVGITADVPAHYNLGGYAIMYVPNLLAQSYSHTGDIQARNGSELAKKFCRVNALNLIAFPDLKLSSYQLNIKIPFWIRKIGLEVWKFIGDSTLLPSYLQRELDSTIYANFSIPKEYVDSVAALNTKLDNLGNSITQQQVTTASDITALNDSIQQINQQSNNNLSGYGGTIIPGIP